MDLFLGCKTPGFKSRQHTAKGGVLCFSECPAPSGVGCHNTEALSLLFPFGWLSWRVPAQWAETFPFLWYPGELAGLQEDHCSFPFPFCIFEGFGQFLSSLTWLHPSDRATALSPHACISSTLQLVSGWCRWLPDYDLHQLLRSSLFW